MPLQGKYLYKHKIPHIHNYCGVLFFLFVICTISSGPCEDLKTKQMLNFAEIQAIAISNPKLCNSLYWCCSHKERSRIWASTFCFIWLHEVPKQSTGEGQGMLFTASCGSHTWKCFCAVFWLRPSISNIWRVFKEIHKYIARVFFAVARFLYGMLQSDTCACEVDIHGTYVDVQGLPMLGRLARHKFIFCNPWQMTLLLFKGGLHERYVGTLHQGVQQQDKS